MRGSPAAGKVSPGPGRPLRTALLAGLLAAPAGPGMADTETLVSRDSPIMLVFWSARDCAYCVRWKADPEGKGELLQWPGFSQVIYREVERPAVARPMTREDFKADIRWLFEQRRDAGKLQPPIPTWSIFVGRREVSEAFGYANWYNTILPQLQELAALREKLRRQAAGGSR